VKHDFQPWRAVIVNKAAAEPSSEFSVLLGSELKPLSELSPLVAALRTAWANDIQVQAFATSRSTLAPKDVIQRLSASEGG
jgi:HD superfamily phosphohydrolase